MSLNIICKNDTDKNKQCNDITTELIKHFKKMEIYLSIRENDKYSKKKQLQGYSQSVVKIKKKKKRDQESARVRRDGKSLRRNG